MKKQEQTLRSPAWPLEGCEETHKGERKRDLQETEDARDSWIKPKDCSVSVHFNRINQSILMTLIQLASPSHTVTGIFTHPVKSIAYERSHCTSTMLNLTSVSINRIQKCVHIISSLLITNQTIIRCKYKSLRFQANETISFI